MRNKIQIQLFLFFLIHILFALPVLSQPSYAVQGSEKKVPEKSDPALQTFRIPVKLELGDGRTLTGKFKFQTPETLIVKHKINEIAYTKKVMIPEISEIEFVRWKGTHVRKTKEGEIYRFQASAINLKLSDGKTFYIEENLFPFLQQLEIENSNGSVSLFSFWMDLLRPDGSWYTGMSGPVSGYRILCHKDVIKRIEFRKDS